ncbi:AAA family ATPase [Candidatus Woesearchaeota archaeon]|nr:AAA family ATPase [Candidatus Woesearchaeota archaeon]
MIINSIKLKNIRSYTDEEINFPEGSVMLSGDIGTGKTSILLSVEFALFGIIRGQVTGSSLLRHGKNEGFVELAFTLEGKKITIRRHLKRSKKTVAQDSGYIIIGNDKHDLTPVELKSKILELIGYPDELLTKSKSLIYRYTVYTPQEEMKQILFESVDERLDVLRRIFDIDKYKRIKGNVLNYIKALKTKKTELETRIEDLEEKKKEHKEYQEKISRIKAETAKIQQVIDIIQKELKEKEARVKDFEDEIKKIESLKNQMEIKTNDVNNKKEKITNDKRELKDVNENILKISKELEGSETINIDELRKQKQGLEEEKKKLSDNLEKINDRESTFNAMKNNSDEIMKKLSSLDECPVCKQNVDDAHKHRVRERENKKVLDIEKQLSKLFELKKQRKTELEEIGKKITELTDKLSKQEVTIVKKERLEEYKKKKENLMKEQLRLKSEVEKCSKEVQEIRKTLETKKGIQENYSEARKMMESVRDKQKTEEIKKAEFVREQRTLEEVMTKVKSDIEKKEKSKKELSSVTELQTWMMKFFLNLVYLMEKQIMLNIHQEFNEHFQEWFNTLIEDESLNVRLDETFTPIIEQNGYDTFLINLSGGERTSVALAYRLALNKVINDFIGLVKTKDLLILDEPTDGFSSEQLDKIREVLEQIRIKQILLVSHEPKLESYVDHIIRVHKEEHVSRVIS